MEDNKVIVIFNYIKIGKRLDIEVPLNITANELIVGLNQGLNLGINMNDMAECYLQTENPIALLKGNKLLEDYGIRNGTVINFTR